MKSREWKAEIREAQAEAMRAAAYLKRACEKTCRRGHLWKCINVVCGAGVEYAVKKATGIKDIHGYQILRCARCRRWGLNDYFGVFLAEISDDSAKHLC